VSGIQSGNWYQSYEDPQGQLDSIEKEIVLLITYDDRKYAFGGTFELIQQIYYSRLSTHMR
jgi:hypothetical protein